MLKRRWTEAEIEYIKAMWNDKTDKDIAYILPGRTESAVASKRRSLGLLYTSK